MNNMQNIIMDKKWYDNAQQGNLTHNRIIHRFYYYYFNNNATTKKCCVYLTLPWYVHTFACVHTHRGMFFLLTIKQLFLAVVCILYMSVSDCRWKLLGTVMERLVALSFFLCLTWSKASGIVFIYLPKMFYIVFNPITWSQKHLFHRLPFIISNGEILTAEPWLICSKVICIMEKHS